MSIKSIVALVDGSDLSSVLNLAAARRGWAGGGGGALRWLPRYRAWGGILAGVWRACLRGNRADVRDDGDGLISDPQGVCPLRRVEAALIVAPLPQFHLVIGIALCVEHATDACA
ncbi:MAG TPA: hypothetical protein VFI76_09975 [Terrimicrobiaceae bacterium]|nr:hypothetical protein [Terrimicrobiaceae bacterium]